MTRTSPDILRTAAGIGGQALRVNPLRTGLSTLGVTIGVASLVAVLSLGDGMERTARSRLQSTTGLQSIAVGSRTVERVDGDFFPLPDTVPLLVTDAAAIRAMTGVASVRVLAQARREVRADSIRRMATVTAVEPPPPSARIVAGRNLAESDTAAPLTAALLSRDLAARIGAGNPAAALGKPLAVGQDSVQVIGVVEADASGPAVIIPLALGPRLLGRRAASLPRFDVEVTRVEDVGPVEAAIGEWLARRTPNWRERFEVATYRARAEQVAQGILIFKLLMGAITGISLVVGGIGIMNVLLASVSERTREIGIRRATGATRRDILLQFLAESVAISGLGSGVGIAIGLAASFGITAAIRRFAQAEFVNASFSWSSVLAAAFASLGIGLLFGTYPARRAAGLSPIDAIRHE
jgi:putative ABC transport system permease protein